MRRRLLVAVDVVLGIYVCNAGHVGTLTQCEKTSTTHHPFYIYICVCVDICMSEDVFLL